MNPCSESFSKEWPSFTPEILAVADQQFYCIIFFSTKHNKEGYWWAIIPHKLTLSGTHSVISSTSPQKQVKMWQSMNFTSESSESRTKFQLHPWSGYFTSQKKCHAPFSKCTVNKDKVDGRPLNTNSLEISLSLSYLHLLLPLSLATSL